MPKLPLLTFALASALFGYAAAGLHVTATASEAEFATEVHNDQPGEQVRAPPQAASDTPTWCAELVPLQCVPASACCKVCSKGKACGDTCISPKKACHVGRGCACDASNVCE